MACHCFYFSFRELGSDFLFSNFGISSAGMIQAGLAPLMKEAKSDPGRHREGHESELSDLMTND
jgi:hypothetical protein